MSAHRRLGAGSAKADEGKMWVYLAMAEDMVRRVVEVCRTAKAEGEVRLVGGSKRNDDYLR